jgi:hypothetical protein
MRETNFKPLTDQDRKKNRYLDQINHAPYFRIILIVAGILLLFTMGTLLGAF